MKILLVSAVIIVVAVAGGLILGGFVSGGLFTGLTAAQGSAVNESGGQAAASDASPGFKIKMGSKSGGASDSGSDAGDDDPAVNTAAAVQAQPPATAGRSSGGGGGSNGNSPSVACTKNSDCGIDGYYMFCSGSSVMSSYRAYSCSSPGTASSSCATVENVSAASVNETCAYRCVDAGCIANQKPVIDSFLPFSDPNIAEGESQTFSVSPSDPYGDNLTVTWKLGNVVLGSGNSYTYTSGSSSVGTYTVVAIVSDGSLSVNQTWTLKVSDVAGISISGPSSGIPVGTNFTVDVIVDSDEKIYAADFLVEYDNDVLQAVGVEKGSFFTSGGAQTFEISNTGTSGLVSYIVTRFQTAAGSSGSGKAFGIKFTALAAGSAEIKISGVNTTLLDEGEGKIAFVPTGGTMNVQ